MIVITTLTSMSHRPRSDGPEPLAHELLGARAMPHPIRLALLSLTTLTLACGPTTEETATGASTGTDTAPADTETATGAATEPTSGAPTTGEPTTGGDEFPLCQAPLERVDVGFTFDGGTLPNSEPIDVMCQISLSDQVDPDISALIDLTCTDADAITHAVRLELRLFAGASLGLPAELEQVRLTHYRVDDFLTREVVTLRGEDDALLLFGGYGYELFNVEDTALRAPLAFAPVRDELCAAEVVAECETRRRSALDVGVGDVSERVFDRAVAALPGFAVHVGAAVDVDRYPNDECIGDSVDGLEVSVVAFAQP